MSTRSSILAMDRGAWQVTAKEVGLNLVTERQQQWPP